MGVQRVIGVYPMQALTLAASTRACGGAWRLVELCFSHCVIVGLNDHGGGHWLANLNANAWIAANAIDERKICDKGGERIYLGPTL
jgi:hypothetical protein